MHDISEIAELQQKLDGLTPPPDIETSEDVIIRVNQLSIAMNTLTSTIDSLTNTIDLLTPAIGEIYITASNENPSVKFGGVWEQIKDVFLLAAGDTYTAGSIGGAAVHFLTVNEMPSHTHAMTRPQWNRNETSGSETNVASYGVTNKTDTNFYENTTGNIHETGGGSAHNNMPPYLTVYVWKRVA